MEENLFIRILLGVSSFFMVKFWLDVDKSKKKIEDLNDKVSDINTKIEVQRTEFNRHLNDMHELKSDVKEIKKKFDDLSQYVHDAQHELKTRRASDDQLIEYFKLLEKKLTKDDSKN